MPETTPAEVQSNLPHHTLQKLITSYGDSGGQNCQYRIDWKASNVLVDDESINHLFYKCEFSKWLIEKCLDVPICFILLWMDPSAKSDSFPLIEVNHIGIVSY